MLKSNELSQGFIARSFGNIETSSDIYYDNLKISEDSEMLSRYHFHNIIYLYGVFEFTIANEICGSNSVKTPLVLYETPMTAYKMQKGNLQNPKILRFAVDINLNSSVDELIEESIIQIKNSKLTKEEIYKRTRYIRAYNTKSKCIEYKVNDQSIIINVQNI